MTLEERRTLFRTRIDLPPDWVVDANGMLLPRCYIDLDEVHRLFRSPRRYLSFLFVRKKDITEQDELCARPFLEIRADKQLRAEAHAESQRLFHLPITKLTEPDRIRIASLLWQNRRTFSRKQLGSPALARRSFDRLTNRRFGGWGRRWGSGGRPQSPLGAAAGAAGVQEAKPPQKRPAARLTFFCGGERTRTSYLV